MRKLQEFLRDDSGATAIEYGLILALMFLAIVGAVQLFAANAGTMYDASSDAINSAIS